MRLLHKIRSYYKIAYTMDHFPSIIKLLLTNKKIFAYYGFLGDGNFGDELVFESCKKLFNPHILIPLRKRMPLSMILFTRIFKNRFSGIVIGGGTLFNRYLEKKYFDGLLKLNKPVYLHGTGVSKNIDQGDGWKKLLSGNIYGGVRGPLTKNYLEKIGFNGKITGDAAFAMFESPSLFKEQNGKKNVLINLGTHKSYDGNSNSRNEIKKFIKVLISHGYNVQFLPMHQIDYKLGLEYRMLFPEMELLDIPANYMEGMKHFEGSLFAIGERLHFIVTAIMSGCSFLSINYASKHEDLLKSVNLSHKGIRPDDVSFELIMKNFENGNGIDWNNVNQNIFNLKNIQADQLSQFISQVG